MKTRHSNQLIRQIGEHLVVSKLGRLGILATPFAGNVPDFDVLASDLSGHCLPLQVKAINGGSWQFDARKFLNIEFYDKDKNVVCRPEQVVEYQKVKGKKTLSNPHLICVFVLPKPDERDDFYIFRLSALQDYCHKGYGKDSKGKRDPGGLIVRTRNRKSTHGAITPREWEQYRVQNEKDWSLIKKHFSPVTKDEDSEIDTGDEE